MEEKIPDDLKKRIPLFQDRWLSMIRKLRDHAHAPRWNAFCGDRLTADDIRYLQAFEEALNMQRKAGSRLPDEGVIRRIKDLASRSWWFEDNLKGIDPADAFEAIPCMERYDLQMKLEQIVPHTADLSGLIVNPTSGTTGQPIPCPSHPRATGCYDPLLRFALQRHGVKVAYNHERVAALQLCCQQHTITYNTVHAFLDGAGFAKINLAPAEWKSPESPPAYIDAMEPVFLSGDPFSFYQAMQLGLTYKPRALLSTALHLTPQLRAALSAYFACPVVNLYSLNETGPIAYSCPLDPETLHILPVDIHVETTGADNEITVTGGRNPFLPLLRYRTGDHGVLDFSPCACGDPQPRIRNLSARKTVFFFTPAGAIINPVDISRMLKDYPVIFHQFVQERDYRCTLRLFTHLPLTRVQVQELKAKLDALFGDQAALTITFDLSPAEGKIIPFICRLETELTQHEYF